MPVALNATARVGARRADLWTQANSRRVGRLIVRLIRRRTAEGVDATGAPFKPYDPDTVEDKDTTRVTLRDTGRMLDTLTGTPTARGVVVKSAAPYAGFVDADRPWLALDDADLEELDAAVAAELNREEERIGIRAVQGGSAL